MAKSQLRQYVFTPGATTTIEVPGKIDLQQLLIITNTTSNKVIYNFADTSFAGTTVTFSRFNDANYLTALDNSDGNTFINIPVSTVGQNASDSLQIFYEAPELTTRPWPMGTDAFERQRVSPPQSMIDADFEYGMQPTKWLTISQMRGYPSIYEVPGTDQSVTAATTDASTQSGGSATAQSIITITTTTAHGFLVGQPFTIKGFNSAITGFDRAEGSFIVYTASTTTFTYIAKGKVGFNNGDNIWTAFVQLRTAGFYTGSTVNAIIPVTVTATTTGTNQLTLSTALTGAQVGNPITLSQIQTNAVATSTATGYVTLGTTIGMVVGQPLAFSGTAFGGLTTGATYYIKAIIDTQTVTLWTDAGLSLTFVPSTTVTGGNMYVTAGGSFGGLTAGNVYYITSIPDSTHLTVSQYQQYTTSIINTSATNNLVQFANYTLNGFSVGGTTNMIVGEALTVTGTTIGNMTAGTYYVYAIIDSVNAQLSTSLPTTAGGTGGIMTQTSATGSMTAVVGPNTQLTSVSGYLWGTIAANPTFTYSTPATQCSFTASISGSVMTVTAVASGSLAVGQGISLNTGNTVPSLTFITSLGTGSGGNGTYNLSTSTGTVSSTNTFVATAAFATITVNTQSPHGLVPGCTILTYITSDNGQNNHLLASGPFFIEQTTSTSSFTFTARSPGFIQAGTTIAGQFYARPDSFYTHRPLDGGVQLGTSLPAHGAQAIRMSKKYIRYQSGKAINFNTGLLMAPNYFVRSVTANGTAIGSTITIVTDDVDHGAQVGATVNLSGVFTAGFNGTYPVSAVVDERTLQVIATNVLSAINPTIGAQIQDPCLLSLVNWYGSSVRSGTYDEQNGTFFQFDGQYISVVKRSSTFQLAGTISVVVGSGQIIGVNTRFTSQLAAGDRIVIRGMSHVVTQVVNSSLLYVNPQWRGANNVSGIKITKTVDYIVPQSKWNTDRMDGSNGPYNPSGYKIDQTKMQMVGMQWTWYGAGSIDWMFRGDKGNYVFCHRLRNNNLNNEAWMRTGNMPVRYEVQNESPAKSYIVGTNNVSNNSVAVGTTDTVIPVFDATYFPLSTSAPVVYVDNELISYTGKYTTTAIATSSTGNVVIFQPATTSIVAGQTVTTGGTAGLAVGQPIVLVNVNGYNLGNIVSNTTYFVQSITTFTGTISGVSYTNAPAITIAATAGGTQLTQVNYQTANSTYWFTANALTGCVRQSSIVPWATGGYRTFTAGAPAIHTANSGIILVLPSASPIVSHWGAAFVQDGGFDTDRSYIFSYQSINVNITTKRTTLFAIRLAPSVSNALSGDLGQRELINRASFLLQGLESTTGTAGTNAAIVIEAIINPSNYPSNPINVTWNSLNSLTIPTGQPSFSQVAAGTSIVFNNSATNNTTATGSVSIGAIVIPVASNAGIQVGDDVVSITATTAFYGNTKVTAINGLNITINQPILAALASTNVLTFSRGTYARPGETVFSFINSPANKDSLDLTALKELTNTPIGGRGTYPNGADVLFVNAYITQGSPINTNMILRWGEAQA
jgi:hypothetical protein